MTKDEALKWALEALEGFYEYGYDRLECFEHITAIKEALAQPEQEPVAWMSEHRLDELSKGFPVMTTLTKQRAFEDDVAFYTTPPQPKEPKQEPVAWEQFYPDIGKPKFVAQPEQEPVAWKLVPIEPTCEMLEAMDECSMEGYDERLYAGHAASVYMAAIDVAPTPPQPKEPEQEPVAWEQFYPDIGKPQLEQLPQLSQEVVLQYPKEAVDWQKQQKEYAQQLKVEGPCHVVCQCDKCKAQEQDNAYIYASNLAKTIWQKHYIKESPKFALLDTTEGVLTQIDNMTCGLVREKPAQPEQEPVAYGMWDTMLGYGGRMMMVRLDKGQDGCTVPLYTTTPQRTWVGLTDEEIYKIHITLTNEIYPNFKTFAHAIEAKLKAKNTREQE